jgi:hypothetical protein
MSAQIVKQNINEIFKTNTRLENNKMKQTKKAKRTQAGWCRA